MEYFILWFFKLLVVFSVFMVIHVANPIHSVLFLILVFCNCAGMVLLLKAEFLAMVFVVVYVGAIAVLFLFVVMMLNIKKAEINYSVLSYLPLGGLLAIAISMQLYYVVYNSFENISLHYDYINWIDVVNSITNIEVLGSLLYTYYFDLFLIGGMILLVAMLGAIVLTLVHRKIVKRQNVFEQVVRNIENSLILKRF